MFLNIDQYFISSSFLLLRLFSPVADQLFLNLAVVIRDPQSINLND